LTRPRASAPSARRPQSTAPAHERLPDFFIVGHAKSGTTALYEMLRAHPQIYVPARKEPWYFASELHERTPPRPGGTPRTLEEYSAWFEGAQDGQRIGEASALYLWSHTAAARIAEVRPDARIIAILREPASFLYSLHLQFIESYIEVEPDFRKAIPLESERREGKSMPRHTYWPQALMYSDHVRYVEQLRRYHEAFSPQQVLVLVYEDFRADNEATVRQVLRFLDVDDSQPVVQREANPTVRVRSGRAHQTLHALSVGHGPVSQTLKAAIKGVTPRKLRRDVLRGAKRNLLFSEPRPPDEQFMLELRGRFKSEVAALSSYLDRDLIGFWGYDGVA
jgi:Sulfotransferase domain